jgi:hypothetical protein
MRYFITGLLVGIALGFVPWLKPAHSFKILPQWYGTISSASTIETSPFPRDSRNLIGPVRTEKGYFMFKENGHVAANPAADKGIIAPSGNGMFYVEYGKLADEISYRNYRGEPFWTLSTHEYPHLSYGGKLILLVTADNSAIRLVDYNGNFTGANRISGRFCTSKGFSQPGNAAATGFLDGSFYFLNQKGEIVYKGVTPGNSIVKSVAISNNMEYGAVHYGPSEKGNDKLLLVHIDKDDTFTVPIAGNSRARTSIHINSNGTAAFLGLSHLYLVDIPREKHRSIDIPGRREGHSSIQHANDMFTMSYTGKKGTSRFYIVHEKGNVLFARAFPEEPYLDVIMTDSSILLRGPDTLYCYSYQP